jgi:predicted dehydrogenase
LSEQLKAGVIGLGLLGSGHVQVLDERSEVKVTAVADIRADKADEIAGRVSALAYSDYEQMLREHKLDIVVVATPDPLHKEPMLAAVKAGVPNIIAEKPLATTLPEAEEMFEAAEKAGTRVFVAFANRGASPLDGATFYVIQEGLLGEVVYGEVRVDDNISVPTRMWGDRSREWAAGSSSAWFLLSHVVDYLRWVLSPAEVCEVYAISQKKVLGYTPDLYDAFLTFDNGAKFRVKGGWIKRVDGLVEFTLSFSGSEGTLDYIKLPGFGQVEGWRANVREQITTEELLSHQENLQQREIPVRALFHRPPNTSPWMEADLALKRSLEAFALPGDWWRLERCFVDAVLEDTLTPSSWIGYGPLPTSIDGLKQTQVVSAIVESAEQDRVISFDR